jgi:hypothetical protein
MLEGIDARSDVADKLKNIGSRIPIYMSALPVMGWLTRSGCMNSASLATPEDVNRYQLRLASIGTMVSRSTPPRKPLTNSVVEKGDGRVSR